MESTLFGHKKGSFTNAVSDQTGKFDAAHKGTLFLDELGELPIATQSKLLRILEDGMVEPLGNPKPHKVDVRIVAATNQDINQAIKDGRFRQDLYYRLNVGEVRIPHLRERRSDIPKIALHILDGLNHSLKKPKRFSIGALRKLRPLIAADGHHFRVFLWESLPGSESMHDRYILTDQCCISAPGGLDCRSQSHPNSTDWSLLDESVRIKRWNDYDRSASPFKLLDDREVR